MSQFVLKQELMVNVKYEPPKFASIQISSKDIITESIYFDENQGEWDPQKR